MIAVGPILELEALLVAPAVLGTASGAVVRDALVQRFGRRGRADLGVLAANLAACAVAGFALGLSAPWQALVAAGFAGGLSTWSGLALEIVGFLRERRYGRLALHAPCAFACALGVLAAFRAFAGGAS